MRFTTWHIPTLSAAIVRSLTEAGLVETSSPSGLGRELARDLHAYLEEAGGAEGARFAGLLDDLVAMLGECTQVDEIFGEDAALRAAIEKAFTTVLVGEAVTPIAPPQVDAVPESLGRLHDAGEGPVVVFDDGTQLPVAYELLDCCGAQKGDRLRARRAHGVVTSLTPFLPLRKAIATLARAHVLEVSTDAVAHEGAWPEALFEAAWQAASERREVASIVALDHDEFTSEAVCAWLRCSGIENPIVTEGPADKFDRGPTLRIDLGRGARAPIRTVGHDLGPEIDRLLSEANTPWRWYALPSVDSRSVFLRLDRETAEALGVGVFGRDV